MAAPDDDTSNGAGGMLNGHGVGIAMIAIFVGMALVVAFAASDGAIFGLNFTSATDNNAPVIDSDTGDAGVLSRDAFDEGSSEEGAPQSDADSSVASAPPQRSATLSEDERRLLAMSDFSWDSIAVEYIASSQDITDKFDQQNFTRQKPAQPGTEMVLLSDRISVDVDRDRDRERDDDSIDIETPIDQPPVEDDEEQQDEPQYNTGQQDDDETEEESDNEGDSGSGSNSTGTNSTSTQDSSESSDEGDGGSDTSGDSLDVEASISLG